MPSTPSTFTLKNGAEQDVVYTTLSNQEGNLQAATDEPVIQRKTLDLFCNTLPKGGGERRTARVVIPIMEIVNGVNTPVDKVTIAITMTAGNRTSEVHRLNALRFVESAASNVLVRDLFLKLSRMY